MQPVFYVACALAITLGLMMHLGGVPAFWCPLPLAILLMLAVMGSLSRLSNE